MMLMWHKKSTFMRLRATTSWIISSPKWEALLLTTKSQNGAKTMKYKKCWWLTMWLNKEVAEATKTQETQDQTAWITLDIRTWIFSVIFLLIDSWRQPIWDAYFIAKKLCARIKNVRGKRTFWPGTNVSGGRNGSLFSVVN